MVPSIVILPKDLTVRDDLLAFMGEHFQDWPTICEQMGETRLIDPKGDHKTPLLKAKGKNLQAQIVSSDSFKYAFSLMRWAALRVGKRKVSDRLVRVGWDEPVPFYLYPPKEAFPILFCKKENPLVSAGPTRFMAVNPIGMPWQFMGKSAESQLKRKVVKTELNRLHKLWKAR